MNKGIFKFRVFRRRRTACRIVAALSAFAMLCVASLPAFAAPTAVLDNDLGGAAINYIKGATHNQIDADHQLSFGDDTDRAVSLTGRRSMSEAGRALTFRATSSSTLYPVGTGRRSLARSKRLGRFGYSIPPGCRSSTART